MIAAILYALLLLPGTPAPVAAALVAPAPVAAASHELGQSYIFLRVYRDSMEVRLEITIDDLDRVLHFGWDSDVGLTREQAAERLDSVLAYVRPRLYVGLEGNPVDVRFVGHDIRDLQMADYLMLSFMIDDLETLPPTMEFGFPIFFDVDSRHRNLLVIEHNWRTMTFNAESNIALIFSPSSPRQTLDLSQSSVLRGFVGFVRLGTWHIWIGLDHILFLLALIFPSVLVRRSGKWEPVPGFKPAFLNLLAIVSSFTVAHSITLSLAALGVVRFPARPVEAIIALSIVVAAVYNIYRPFNVREWTIAFVFGLFHGFGFANVLSALALDNSYLALTLLGFNVGVEIGQFGIMVVVFPALFLLRNQRLFLPAMRYASMMLIALALFWFVERASGVPLTQYAMKAPGYFYRHVIIGV